MVWFTYASWARFNGHNSAIFIRFWHPTTLKWSARDKLNGVKNLALSRIFKFSVFDPFFAPRPHMGSIARMVPKPPYARCWYMQCPGNHPNLLLKIESPPFKKAILLQFMLFTIHSNFIGEIPFFNTDLSVLISFSIKWITFENWFWKKSYIKVLNIWRDCTKIRI